MKTKLAFFFCACLVTAFIQAQTHLTENDSLSISSDTLLLNELVVTAQRPLVKVDLDKITYNLEEDPEASTNNLLEMLKKVPMVTVDGEENVQLKGSTNFKFYMNGKPSNLISNNPKDVLKSIPANTVKSIEVITDPGAKYDAEGVNGIINIITQSQSSLGGYTVTLNGGADSQGGYNGGTYFSLKYGKVGFTGNVSCYNFRPPKGKMTSFRDDFVHHTILSQEGERNNHGNGLFGYGELSYEIDTFNLVNFSFNKFGGNYHFNLDQTVQMTGADEALIYQYKRLTHSEQEYGNSSIGVDYQRTFAVQDRLLTFSYLYDVDPNDSYSDNQLTEIYHFEAGQNRQYSNASTQEHTLQVDFTTPVADIHTIETGLKYIRRVNESNSKKYLLSGDEWLPLISGTDDFDHIQDILAAYAGYSLKQGKWGVKTGLRYETLWLNAVFPLKPEMNFDRHYSNFIPSATATYMLNPGQTLRAGYNLRIQRPGIWYLNPYVNTSDTSFIRSGNPNLEAVLYHALNFNYNFYASKFMANAGFSYSFTNNGIEEVVEMKENSMTGTYQNIAKSKTLSLSAYLSWTPNSKLRLSGNFSGSYTDIQANNETGLQNSGYSGSVYGNAIYTLPWDLKFGFSGYHSTPRITLQGENYRYFFWGFSLSKSFLDDKLNVRLSADNIFRDTLKLSTKQSSPNFYYEMNNYQNARRFGISVSYRFGEMKTQIKKAQRSIKNDDNMSGGSQSGGSGGAQGGEQ